MWIIVKYFWQICLLRASPENIPSSKVLIASLLFAYTLISIITLYTIKPELGFVSKASAIMLELGVEAGVLFGILFFKNVRARFLSAYAALLATNVLLTAMIFPLNIFLMNMADGILADFFEATSIVIFFWWLSIIGFIFNKSGNISMIQGVMLALIIELLVFIVTKSLLPEFYPIPN
ncbi:MAG: hypothetical protein ACI9FB_002641 [Candidatus Azotimanducaceae bacterium]|jgi:hypothetical protein